MISNLGNSTQEPGPDPTAVNVLVFSEKIASAIKEVLSARALHPATVMGVLAYHSLALASLSQRDMMAPPKSSLIVTPPPGFKLPHS